MVGSKGLGSKVVMGVVVNVVLVVLVVIIEIFFAFHRFHQHHKLFLLHHLLLCPLLLLKVKKVKSSRTKWQHAMKNLGGWRMRGLQCCRQPALMWCPNLWHKVYHK